MAFRGPFPRFVPLIATLALAAPGAVAGSKDRRPVPPEEERAERREQIGEMYRKELRASAKAGRQALAHLLMERARESKDDPPARYVLLEQARRMAARGGHAWTARHALAAMAEAFDVDLLARSVETLRVAADRAGSERASAQCVDLALRLADRYADRNAYRDAKRCLSLVSDAARRLDRRGLRAAYHERRQRLNRTMARYRELEPVRAELEKRPGDPRANRLVGAFHAFYKGDWEKGLPLLARGDEKPLREAAETDLADRDDRSGWVNKGDAWYALAEGRSEPQASAMIARARYWYTRALPRLSGFTRKRVLERLKGGEDRRVGDLLFRPGAVAAYARRSFRDLAHAETVRSLADDWGGGGPPGAPGRHFRVRYRGWIQVDRPGRRVFRFDLQNGRARLSMGKGLVLEGRRGAEGAAHLHTGLNPFELVYWHHGGRARFRLLWRRPGAGGNGQPIRGRRLFHRPGEEKPIRRAGR